MTYEIKNFDHLVGLKGFSDQLLHNHFKLYAGYVTNTNKLLEELKRLEKEGKAATPEYAEYKRRFGWEFNGMRLHELYFANMTKSAKPLSKGALAQALTQEFGSVEAWLEDFKKTGALRGIGWAVLVYDAEAKRLFNIWVNEHDVGHLVGCTPLLIMDVFEHAFMIDYGLNRADYIKAFLEAIDYNVVEARFK